MARLTVKEAATKTRQLAAALRRLDTLQYAEVTGTGRRHEHGSERANRLGRRHELDAALALVDELMAGLEGPGPARDGQLGGQRQGGHDTSAQALALVAPKAGTQRDALLRVVWQDDANYGLTEDEGLTDVELQTIARLPANSERPRRVELVDAGWLMDSGRRRKHKGREHVVWTLTPEARDTLNNKQDTPTEETP